MISGIILASGFSKRMEKEKLLLPVGGVPLIERVIKVAQASCLDEVILVYRENKIKEAGERFGVKTVYNHQAHKGQSAAIKCGINAAHPQTDAFMFLVGDQPFLNPSSINTLIDTFRHNPYSIIVSVYYGKRGNPVIFPAQFKDNLLSLSGDSGGRIIIESSRERVKFVDIKENLAGLDIDTEEDYEKIKKPIHH